MIQIIFEVMIKITLMIALGALLKKIGVITEELQRGLSNLLLKAILPINIIASANSEFTKELSSELIQVSLIAICYYIISIVLVRFLCKALPIGDKMKKVFLNMSVFANTAFMGFPVVGEVYGEKGILFAVIYNLFFQLFFFTYGINILDEKKGFEIKSLLKNPVTIASVASIVLFLSPFRLPEVLQSTVSSIGGMMVPVSMMIIGCSLVGLKFSSILTDKYSYVVSSLRLLIFPLSMMLVLNWIGLSWYVVATCTVMTALPCGSLNVILAQQYECEPEFAARTVIQSMVFMIVTLPLIIFIVK